MAANPDAAPDESAGESGLAAGTGMAPPGSAPPWRQGVTMTCAGRRDPEGDRMATPSTVDEYMAELPDDRRVVLEQLRKTINAAAPEATETIAYQMPALRSRDGQFLVSYASYKAHYSLFPANDEIVRGPRGGDPAVPGRPGHDPVSGEPSHSDGARHEGRQDPARRGRSATTRVDLTEAGASRSRSTCRRSRDWPRRRMGTVSCLR